MRDVDALIPPGSGLQLTNAFNNNERGEIVAKSFPIETTPNDDADLGHLVLLIPCNKDDHEGECSGRERSDDDAVAPPASAPAARAAAIPHSPHSLTAEDGDAGWRGRLARRLGTKAPNK
jgi:hypothetical protein